jgi:hypothetical protein
LIAVSFTLNAAGHTYNADDKTPTASPRESTLPEVDIRAVLKAGQTAKSLPAGVVLRVEADLFMSTPADKKVRAEAEARGVDFSKKLKEIWEFTSNHVHQVVVEVSKGNRVYRRIKSVPFDTKNLCRNLLDGKIYLIAEEDGEGKALQFVGTDFDFGGRSIDILVQGASALWVGEHCAYAGYPEKEARAFAALYEKLATQARAAFQEKPALNASPKKKTTL